MRICSKNSPANFYHDLICEDGALGFFEERCPQHEQEQGNHAIAMMTARCAQYVSAVKIVGLCKRKNSRRLRKNLHITILSLFCGEIIFEVFHPM